MNIKYFIINALLALLLTSGFVQAADLVFTPATPSVEMEGKITLSVSGTSGEVKWSAISGWIEGTGTTVTYVAPSQDDFDVVTVSDGAGNVGVIKITITLPPPSPPEISLENAVWEIFTSRDTVNAFALSKDRTILWVGTGGGLEKRNALTGKLDKIYINTDGLPFNWISALLADEQRGVWISAGGGLTHLKANGSWQIFNEDNSNLPDYSINALLSDKQGGIWVGTDGGGLAHLRADGSWQIFNTKNSNLPYNDVYALSLDNQGGVWIGTAAGRNIFLEGAGLAHLKADGSWQVFNTDNSNLPSNNVQALVSDAQGGVWIGTKGGLAHLKADGSWQVFNTGNSNLPSDWIETLILDEQGEVWVGTDGSGLAHLRADGSWQIFNTNNSNLPYDDVYALISDTQGGVWIGTGNWLGIGGGIAYLKADGSWQTFNEEYNSDLPSNHVTSLISDAQGRVWVGTKDNGLAHFKADGSWQVFNNIRSISEQPENEIRFLLSDKQGGIWVSSAFGGLTHGDGLAHFKADGSWQFFNTNNSNLPSNIVTALISDDQGGIWVDTYVKGNKGSLVHIKKDGSWQIFNEDNSNLPFGFIYGIIPDEQGGVWVETKDFFQRTEGGLAHFKADDSWQVFNQDNSNLPDYNIEALLSDEQGGVWIGTDGGGLAHLKADGSWQVFTTENSNLPRDDVKTLFSDKQGRVWIGTDDGGLAHLKADGSWQVFTTENSNLPRDDVKALFSDKQGGVWVVMGDYSGSSLAHFKADSSWQFFNTSNSNLPKSQFKAILLDEQGGVWVGTKDSGLAYLKADGSWQVFNTGNSNLPSNRIETLIIDEQGEVWVGTVSGGLVHLKLGEQQSGKRAAIIIAGGGSQATNSLWDTTESISTYFYKMLNNRKFINSEIYYLSSHPWADFNGDGFNDKIVDAPRPVRPINLDDIKQAFEWAKDQGKLDQPLYVFFIDHGGDGKLQLAKNTNMAAEEFKTILDDYQQATGNQVVAIIEACYSGSHLPILQAPNRAIISSARDNELAYFEGKQGFSRFFTKSLLKGMNFLEAFDYSTQQQSRMLTKMDERLSGGSAEHIATTQTPQLDDNSDGVYIKDSDGQWLKQLRINGNIQTGDFTLAVESLTTSSSIQVGQPFSLRAKASTASGRVKRVWAVIRPPRMNLVIDSNGTPILAYPTEELSSTEEADIWAGTWNQAVYNGDYEISFYTKDNEGNTEMSEESVVISVTGGVEPPASASVDIVIEKERYARGESFKFELVEQLGWGYDLYAAVVLPDSQFMTLEGPNKLAKLNQPEKWYKSRKYSEKVTAIDMTLPADLAAGKYCLYGILSPQREEPLEVMDKWVYSQKCFEVF